MKKEKLIPIFIGVVSAFPLLLLLTLIIIFGSRGPGNYEPKKKEFKEMKIVTSQGDTIEGKFEILEK